MSLAKLLALISWLSALAALWARFLTHPGDAQWVMLVGGSVLLAIGASLAYNNPTVKSASKEPADDEHSLQE